MTVTAEKIGRNLHLTLEGIPDAFIFEPVPGEVGIVMTDLFVQIMARRKPASDITEVMRTMGGAENYARVSSTLSTSEGQSILMPAFYWQTVLGMDGVNAYLADGGGLAGEKKALSLLIMSLGVSPTQIAPSTALESLIGMAPTPTTGANTTNSERPPLPQNKRGHKQPQKKNPRS